MMEPAMELCDWAVPSLMLAAAVWMVFFPPRKVRSWFYFMRPVLGLVTGQAAVCALLFGVVRPLIKAQFEAHNGNILLCYPVDMLQPVHVVVEGVIITCLVLFVHGLVCCWKECRW